MATERRGLTPLAKDRCISGGLRFLAEMAEHDVLDPSAREAIRQQSADIVKLSSGRRLKLAVVGEFSAGKSTLINALLGLDILASDIEPTTAVATHLTWGPSFQVDVAGADGVSSLFDIPTDHDGRPTRDALNGVLADLRAHEGPKLLNDDGSLPAASRPVVAEFIRTTEQAGGDGSDEVIIRLPSEYLAGAVDLLDTPGFNPGLDEAAKERHKAVTMRCVESSHLALFVIDGRNPLKATEQRYLEALKPYLSRIFFVVNKMDALVDEDDDDDEAIDTEEYIHEELPAKFDLAPDEATVYFVTPISHVPDAASRFTDGLNRLRGDVISFMGRSREAIVLEKTARYLNQSAQGVHDAVRQREHQQNTKLVALQSKQILAPEEMASKVIGKAMPAFAARGSSLLETLPRVIDDARRHASDMYARQLSSITDKRQIKQAAIDAAGGTFQTYFGNPIKRHVVDALAEAIREALRAMDREFRQLYAGIQTAQPGGPSKSAVLSVANNIVQVQAAGGEIGRAVAAERAKGVAWEVGGSAVAGAIGVALLGPVGIGLVGLGRALGSAIGPSAEELKSKACTGFDVDLRKKGPAFLDLARGCVSGHHAQFNELLNKHAHDQIDRYTRHVHSMARAHEQKLVETKQILHSLTRSGRQARELAADAAARAEEVRRELAVARVDGQVDRTLVLDQLAIDSVSAGLLGSVINGAHDVPEKVERWYGGNDCILAGEIDSHHEAAVEVAKGVRSLIDSQVDPIPSGRQLTPVDKRHLSTTGLSPLDLELVLPRMEGADEQLDHMLDLTVAAAVSPRTSPSDIDEPGEVNAVLASAEAHAAFWAPAVRGGQVEQNSQFVQHVETWASTRHEAIRLAARRRFAIRAVAGVALAASILFVLLGGIASGVIAWGVSNFTSTPVLAATAPDSQDQRTTTISQTSEEDVLVSSVDEDTRTAERRSAGAGESRPSSPTTAGASTEGGGGPVAADTAGPNMDGPPIKGAGKAASSSRRSERKRSGTKSGSADSGTTSRQTGELSISHTKPKTVYLGQDLSLSVRVVNEPKACRVKVYYKNGIDWTSRTLNRSSKGRYSTTLDSDNLMTTFEYYFKASCGDAQVRSGSRSSPHRLRIL